MKIPVQLTQPSTYAGLGVVFAAIAQLLTTRGFDVTAWASLAAGVVAIVKNDTPAKPQ